MTAPLDPSRLAEFRAVAQAATPGPWNPFEQGGDWGVEAAGHYAVAHRFEVKADAVFIATFDPPTVLKMMDALQRLRTEIDEWREECAIRAANNGAYD